MIVRFHYSTSIRRSIILMHRKCFSRNVLKHQDKGLFHDIFPSTSAHEIIDLCNGAPQTVYAGFDPTARSLHVGNLLILANLLHWQRGGHRVVALIGGATGRIGDPSGRNKEREEQKEEVVKENVNYISNIILRIFENHKKYFWNEKTALTPVNLVNNAEWYKSLSCVDFICGIGRHLRLGQMLSRTSVAARLQSEQGISFTEFSYQVFQAFDWLHLLNKYDCRIQIGGSDQMGNIMTGHELITRVTRKSVYGITSPLITSESGDKFGKTAGNAVWLDPDMTSPFELYQFFIRLPDSKVSETLSLLTFLSAGEIKDLVAAHMKEPDLRKGQKYLAEKVTLLVHGEEGLASAENTTKALYSRDVTALAGLSWEDVTSGFHGAELVEILLRPGITVLEAALAARCFLTQSDAERIIKAGGFYINHQRSTNPSEILVNGLHILPNKISLLRVGKKNYWVIRWLS
ncbi:tyrosine--tRNA ligase, mitochondrial [Halyomorpha halys]|uniref:tyrosine--tRNA ligase, mitochondrial n=1 Tax=Halyomorpha halys TaxID=286706 RepID=UPI0006D4CEFD|nr:tyrosine--tRNA ligase, mitochondrial [Halyomorpha halys]